jgi:hypothetical protein
MKLNRQYFFIITAILILALFGASTSIVPVESSSKVMVEKIIEESSSEKNGDIKYLITSLLSDLEYQIQLEIHAYSKAHYTYTYTKSIYKPPRYS